MAEQKTTGSSNFKEAVCIDAGRVYDSCSEMECSSLTTQKSALLCGFSAFHIIREDLPKKQQKRAGFCRLFSHFTTLILFFLFLPCGRILGRSSGTAASGSMVCKSEYFSP